jgi:hypothetical protein
MAASRKFRESQRRLRRPAASAETIACGNESATRHKCSRHR